MPRYLSVPLLLTTLAIILFNCQEAPKEIQSESIAERVKDRDYPSIFQAWYGIDMPEYPQGLLEQRLASAAKHDLLWEEPLSQLGEGADLTLGLVWEGEHHGLSRSFTKESLNQALSNKQRLLELNPNMVFLFEIRWRDAPSSFLPEDSEFWLRDEASDTIVKGWLGGWEPFYMLDYDNEAFQANVAEQAKIALKSGVYDGVMLDWSGHLPIVKKVREAIGEEGLIIVNIHDNIEDGRKYAPYINGSFMELNPLDSTSIFNKRNKRNWNTTREALVWFENNLKEPKINCLEVWGDRKDLSRMRATTTLGLTHSDGYVLYGDPNPLKTPDHLHDWYPFWEVELGKPIAKMNTRSDGAFQREFEKGTVIYNHLGNGPIKVSFPTSRKRISTGEIGTSFELNDRDGDIFSPVD
ncbi:MAG: hypothetical protein AAFO07_08780 [Bacteroidota bacterium]